MNFNPLDNNKPIAPSNSVNLTSINNTNDALIRLAFICSTITSAICCAIFQYSILAHRNEWFDWWFAYCVYGATSLYFCYLVDKGVERYGTFVLTEMMYGFAGFRLSVTRLVNLTFAFIVGGGCFLFSFWSSYSGTSIVAAIAQPAKVESNMLLFQINSENKAREIKLKPYQDALSDAKEAKELAIKNALGKDNYKAYQRGSNTILTEFKPTLSKIDKDFAASIATAQKELDNAKTEFSNLASLHSENTNNSMKRKNEQAANSLDAVLTILDLLGVKILFVGLALLGLKSVSQVSKDVHKLQQADGNQRKNTQPIYNQRGTHYEEQENF